MRTPFPLMSCMDLRSEPTLLKRAWMVAGFGGLTKPAVALGLASDHP